jgi:hypothetical protein
VDLILYDDDALFTEKAVVAKKESHERGGKVKGWPYFLEHSNLKCRKPKKNNWNEKKSHL